MARSEDGTPAPLQQTNLQAGLSGHSEKGGTDAGQGIQASDEGDCGTSPQ